MLVLCKGCDQYHKLSPIALGIVISAFQDGDLQRVTKGGIEPDCLAGSFTDDRVASFRKKNPRNDISIDNVRYLPTKGLKEAA